MIGGGLPLTVVPTFIQETAPIRVRAQLGTLTNTLCSVGIILAFTMGLGLPHSDEEKISTEYWRFMFLMPILIALVQATLILVFFKYETPLYLLLNKNDEQGARNVLRKIYYESDIDNVIEYLRKTNMN